MKSVGILIVGDRNGVAGNIGRVLESMGYHVTGIVASPVEAIERTAESNPQLVLMAPAPEGRNWSRETATVIRSRLDVPVLHLGLDRDSNSAEPHPVGEESCPAEDLDLFIRSELRRRRTENRSKEDYFRKSGERTETSVGLWEWDALTGEVIFSPQWIERIGHVPEEVNSPGYPWYSLVHPEDRKRLATDVEALAAGKMSGSEAEIRVLTGTGEWKWARARCDVVKRDDRSVPARILGTIVPVEPRNSSDQTNAKSRTMLEALVWVQNEYITGTDPRHLFNGLLDNLVSLTGSEYGFIDEIFITEKGTPYRRAHAISDSVWTKEYQPLIDRLSARRFDSYTQDNLPGLVMVTGRTVISNDPTNDPRVKRIPQGHPPLRSFLGLPLKSGDKLIGIAAVANRPGGYDQEIGRYVEPYLKACARIIEAYRNDQRRSQAEQALRESSEKYRALFENSPVALCHQDWSGVKAFVEELKDSGFSDVKRYMEESSVAFRHCAGLVDIVDVNRAWLDLFEIDHADDVSRGPVPLAATWPDESGIKETMVAVAENRLRFSMESVERTFHGSDKDVLVKWTVTPGHEQSYSDLLFSIVDITDLKNAQEHLKRSLREKEVLLREVHHRVKNNLQVMLSLLNLLFKSCRDDGAGRLLKDLGSRIRAMAVAHEKLYDSGNLARLNVGEYVDGVADHLVMAYSTSACRIVLHKSVSNVSFGLDTAVPLGFILNELVTNCIKHAFADRAQGNIHISIEERSDGRFELIVSDDGIGIPAAVNWRNPTTFGLGLVHTLVRQLDGTMEFRSGRGTEARLQFRDIVRQKTLRVQ